MYSYFVSLNKAPALRKQQQSDIMKGIGPQYFDPGGGVIPTSCLVMKSS